MNVSFKEIDNQMEFRLTDVDDKYIPVFEMCYYSRDSEGFFKRFSKDIENLELIMSNFSNQAENMFNQLGYFTPVLWEEALEEFCVRIQGSDIRWWLTGSCACCIRGIELNPHDVDIIIDSRDKQKVIDLFLNWIIEPIVDASGWVTKDFGVLFKHARIDIASDPNPVLDSPEPVDCGPYAQAHLETVDWRGYKIKVPPLHLQEYVNRKRGRIDRADMIRDTINGKK